jgi:hypothetical protein
MVVHKEVVFVQMGNENVELFALCMKGGAGGACRAGVEKLKGEDAQHKMVAVHRDLEGTEWMKSVLVKQTDTLRRWELAFHYYLRHNNSLQVLGWIHVIDQVSYV